MKNLARITLTLPIPMKLWQFLCLPVTIPFMIVFAVLAVPLFYLIACLDKWSK